MQAPVYRPHWLSLLFCAIFMPTARIAPNQCRRRPCRPVGRLTLSPASPLTCTSRGPYRSSLSICANPSSTAWFAQNRQKERPCRPVAGEYLPIPSEYPPPCPPTTTHYSQLIPHTPALNMLHYLLTYLPCIFHATTERHGRSFCRFCADQAGKLGICAKPVKRMAVPPRRCW